MIVYLANKINYMNNEDEFVTPQQRENKFKDLNEQTDNENNRTANDNVESGQSDKPVPSTQAEKEDTREILGGATNLSLDQLKESEPDKGAGS